MASYIIYRFSRQSSAIVFMLAIFEAYCSFRYVYRKLVNMRVSSSLTYSRSSISFNFKKAYLCRILILSSISFSFSKSLITQLFWMPCGKQLNKRSNSQAFFLFLICSRLFYVASLRGLSEANKILFSSILSTILWDTVEFDCSLSISYSYVIPKLKSSLFFKYEASILIDNGLRPVSSISS